MNHERVKSHDTVPLKMDGTVVYVRYSAHIYMFLHNLNIYFSRLLQVICSLFMHMIKRALLKDSKGITPFCKASRTSFFNKKVRSCTEGHPSAHSLGLFIPVLLQQDKDTTEGQWRSTPPPGLHPRGGRCSGPHSGWGCGQMQPWRF